MVALSLYVTDPDRAKALELALEWLRNNTAVGNAPVAFNAASARRINEVAAIFYDFLSRPHA